MENRRFDILWQGVRFWVEAGSPDHAQDRVMAQLAADGIVAHAWQIRVDHESGLEATEDE
jgi:hypothetical protein